jgi:hypothetical protein
MLTGLAAEGQVVLPVLRILVSQLDPRSRGLIRLTLVQLLALQVLLLLVLGLGGMVNLGLGAILVLLGEGLGRARANGPAAVVLAAAVMLTHLAVALEPGLVTTALFLAQLALTFPALGLLAARMALHRIGGRRPREAPAPGELIRRVLLGLLAAALVLALALLLLDVASPTPRARREKPVTETREPPPPPTTDPWQPPPESPPSPPDDLDLRPSRPPPPPPPPESPPPGPGLGEATGAWGEQLLDQLRSILEGEPERPTLQEVGSSLFTGPMTGSDPYFRYPLGVYLGILTQILIILLVLRAWLRRRRKRALPILRRAPPSRRAYDRLLRALASYGHLRAPGQTPREFARQVIGARGLPFRPLETFTEIYYRGRFGGREPTRDERAFLEDFLRKVETHALV